MSSPGGIGGKKSPIGWGRGHPLGCPREGTRVILREITANLQNSSPGTSPRRKSGNEAQSIKADQQQHDVKVTFIREFAEAPVVREAPVESTSSLSSASSFQSIASTLSSKCSSGICIDSSPNGDKKLDISYNKSDISYSKSDISGLDDLISACEKIRIDDEEEDGTTIKEASFELRLDNSQQSLDATFASAYDKTSPEISPTASENALEGHLNPVFVDALSSENFQLNIPDEISDPLDITADLNPAGESTSKNIPEEANLDEETNGGNSTINFGDEVPNGLNATADLSGGNSTINLPKEISSDLNATADLSAGNSTINLLKEISSNLDATADLSAGNSTINLPKEIPTDLNATADLSGGNSTINLPKEIPNELITDEDLKGGNTTVNLSKELQLNLDDTRDTTAKDLLIIAPKDIEPKENPENLPICPDANSELDETRIIDRDTEASLFEDNRDFEFSSNFGNRDLSLIKEIENSRGSDVTPESVGLHKDSSDPDVGISRYEKSPEKLILNRTSDGKDLEKLSEHPIESLAPEIREFQANSSKSPTKEATESVCSPIKQISTNLIGSASLQPIVDHLGTFSCRNEENSKIPELSTTSSHCAPARLNETIDLPLNTEENFHIPKRLPQEVSISEKFQEISKNPEDNLIAAIAEPSFIRNPQNFVDNSLISCNANLLERENLNEIEEKNKIEDIIANSKANELEQNFKTKIDETFDLAADKLEKPNLGITFESEANRSENREIDENRSGSSNAEIDKESFPDEKPADDDDSAEGLNATKSFQDLSTDDILAVPESDQYAGFQPQKQSTALVSNILEQNSICRPIGVPEDYAAFLPQKQSTVLPNFAPNWTAAHSQTSFLAKLNAHDTTPFYNAPLAPLEQIPVKKTSPKKLDDPEKEHSDFSKLQIAANSVANDIINSSIEANEETEQFFSAESELFQDPSNFDFLLSKTPKKNTKRDLRAESLYVKFDPLVSNTSMLPQGNVHTPSPPLNAEARNGDNNTTIGNIGTPKRNPAIAAIDRLLFYSPMTANTTPTNTNTTLQKIDETQEKQKPTEETSEETINMAKELELVRTTVIQLEEQLEKLKIDHEEALEKNSTYKEKINQLQAQLAQEIKNKNEITVVVDEYEISISRLVAERERDRKNLDLEKAKLQEELAAAKHHLDNTEAAFNDVHLKYERLKAVVATYKNNEATLKESLQENVEIIKSLENRYEQVKSHATARLEKANQELDAIRKQNDSEMVRLQAMLRKADLKSNSLAELVEQKTKENKELTQILDEVIARVGRNKPE